ncbi:MAG: hypothetical protein PUF72_09550 [Clostridiales bacterium]|nr:hypothetical protein [Clostridiales bacterium]
MKVLTEKEAYNFIVSYSENTVIIEKNDNEYIFISTIEEREYSAEYPEGMVLYLYSKGAGWSVTRSDFEALEGTTIIEKLVCAQGLRCGAIYMESECVIERYMSYAQTFINGTDEEIQDILPYLAPGKYCLCFTNIEAVKEQLFRICEREYRISDAQRHINDFCQREYENVSNSIFMELLKFLNQRVDRIVNLFEKNSSCEVCENDTWDGVLNDMSKEFFKTRGLMIS